MHTQEADDAISNPSLKGAHVPVSKGAFPVTRSFDFGRISLGEVIIEIVDHILSRI